jgi:hypothetical protein
MSSQINTINKEQTLGLLSRQSCPNPGEITIVASTGSKQAASAGKVISSDSYNIYNVVPVHIGQPGTVPVIIGQACQAVNLAESFQQQGTLAAGAYIVMFSVGGKNIFYAQP